MTQLRHSASDTLDDMRKSWFARVDDPTTDDLDLPDDADDDDRRDDDLPDALPGDSDTEGWADDDLDDGAMGDAGGTHGTGGGWDD